MQSAYYASCIIFSCTHVGMWYYKLFFHSHILIFLSHTLCLFSLSPFLSHNPFSFFFLATLSLFPFSQYYSPFSFFLSHDTLYPFPFLFLFLYFLNSFTSGPPKTRLRLFAFCLTHTAIRVNIEAMNEDHTERKENFNGSLRSPECINK